ncbi:histidine phosphatase superfamily [Hyaloraphidium curvatum]|nr:histidine phosphatase superfamily [Hyaloraphidium curvatum]
MPRKIILVRHGQSEGNVDWSVMATKPDHMLELTEKGRDEALQVGKQLRRLVDRDDRVRFYVSPYVRARQTLDGILRSFGGARPPAEEARKEPRLREQDWGNFQNFVEMEKIKAERMAYGHFFYRIPHGESGADVHDRLSIFLDALARSQARSYPNHPTVLIVVTHGLLARLFVMRFMRLSVAEFEKWKNLRNCEYLVMERVDASERTREADAFPPPPDALNSYRLTVPPSYRDDSPSKRERDGQRREMTRRLTMERRATVEDLAKRMGAGFFGLGSGGLTKLDKGGAGDGPLSPNATGSPSSPSSDDSDSDGE